jgi:hypothetical protein
MTPRNNYHCEEEVERLIHNLAQWGGDGASVVSSASIWERLVRETKRGSNPIVTVGVDAGYTKAALKVIGEQLAEALFEYHTSAYPLAHQVRKLKIALSTYRRRLEAGHVAFMVAYHDARRASKL